MKEKKHSTSSLIVLMLTFSVFPLWPLISVPVTVILLFSILIALILKYRYKKIKNDLKYEKILKYINTRWEYLWYFLGSNFIGMPITYFAFYLIDEFEIIHFTIFLTSLSLITLIIASITFFRDKKRKYNLETLRVSMILIVITIIVNSWVIPNMVYSRGGYRPHPCSGMLRNIGIIVTNYSTDHKGHYPQNLNVLTTLGYIEALPTCPETGADYIYEISGWDSDSFTVWCPNPGKHCGSTGPKSKTASLYYVSGRGVTQVDEE